MFRSLSGFKTQYHYLTILVALEFNEWRVCVHGPGVIIQGHRQFSEAKAKEHALALARSYVHEEKQEDLPVLTEVEWAALAGSDWLVWHG